MVTALVRMSKSQGGGHRASILGARPPRAVASRRSPHEGGAPPSEPAFDSQPLLRLVDGVLAPFCITWLLKVVAERVGIRSRAAAAFALPLGGQAPSRRRFAPVTP